MSTWTDGHGLKREVIDVFISYGSTDSARVAPIGRQLITETLTAFWDRKIPPGVNYVTFLAQALESSRIVLVVWSRDPIKSEWVCAEAELARSRKRLVSCKVDKCTPIPPFNTFQTVDLSDWKGEAEDENWRKVADLIRLRVKSGNATSPIGEVNEWE